MIKNSKTRLLAVEAMVGLFMIVVLGALGVFTVVLSRESIFKKTYPMQVHFSNVLGLRDGDKVVVKGMPVGKVHSLSLQNDGVIVDLALDRDLRLRTDYAINIRPTSVLGGRQVEVDPGALEGKDLARDVLFDGLPPFDMFDEGEKLFRSISSGLSDGNLFGDLQKSATNLRELTDRLAEGQGTLGRLMAKDDTLYRDLAATMASVRAITTRLETGEGAIGKLLSGDGQLYKDLAEAVAAIKTITARIERGEGSLGKLLSDEALYDEVHSLVGEVRATVDDVRESVPITTFSSIFFGAF